jgi:hypothetical protein
MNRAPVPSAVKRWGTLERLVAGVWLGGVFAWLVFELDYLARREASAQCHEKAFEEGWSSG